MVVNLLLSFRGGWGLVVARHQHDDECVLRWVRRERIRSREETKASIGRRRMEVARGGRAHITRSMTKKWNFSAVCVVQRCATGSIFNTPYGSLSLSFFLSLCVCVCGFVCATEWKKHGTTEKTVQFWQTKKSGCILCVCVCCDAHKMQCAPPVQKIKIGPKLCAQCALALCPLPPVPFPLV